MSSNDRELKFKITTDGQAARRESDLTRDNLLKNFGDINKVGQGALQALTSQASTLLRQIPLIGPVLAGVTQQIGRMAAASVAYTPAAAALVTANAELAASESGVEAAALKKTTALEAQAAAEAEGAAATAAMLGPLVLVAGAMLALGAASVGVIAGLFKATDAAADYAEGVYKAHLRTGAATETISGFALAATRANVPLDQLSQGLARAEKNAVQAALGNKKLAQSFEDIGVNVKDALTDPTKFLTEFAERLGQLPDGGKKAELAIVQMGKSGQQLIPVVNQMKDGVSKLIEEADRLGLKLTTQQAKELVAYKVSMRELQASFKGLEVVIGKEFAPAAIQAVQGVTQIIVGARPLLEPIFRFVGFEILNTINQIKFLLAAIETIPYALSMTGDALATLAVVLATTAVNFTDLGEVAKLTGAAIYLALTGNTQAASAVMDAALLQVKKGLQDATNIAHIAYTKIADEFKRNLAEMYKAAPVYPEGGTDDATLHPPPKKGESEETALNRRLKLLEDQERKIQDLYESEKADTQKLYDERLLSLQEMSDREKAIEKVRFTGLNEVFTQEKLLIQASGVAQDLKAAKIADVDKKIADNKKQNTLDRDAIDKNQHDKEQAALDQHLAKLVEIQTAGDRLRIEQIKKLAAERVITYAQAEQQIEAIERLALVARRERLEKELVGAGANKEIRQRVLDDLKALGVEIAAFESGAETSTEEAQTKDAERKLANKDAVRKYQEEITRITREGEAIRLDAMKHSGASQQEIIRETYKQQQQAIDDAYKSRKADFELQVKQLSINDNLKKQNADKINSIQDEIKALDTLHGAQTQTNKDEERRATERANPNSARSLFGDTFKDSFDAYNQALIKAGKNTNNFRASIFGLASAAADAFHRMSEDAGNFTSIAIEGFKQLTAGVGDLISNWVLMGEVGPQALRKLLAAILAHFAASWIVKAIDLIGEGLSDEAKAHAAEGEFLLTGNPAAAAAAVAYHTAAATAFLAAAKYGAGGAIVAVVGRVVAGNSSSSQSGSAGSGTGGGQDNQPNNRQFNYNTQVTPSQPGNFFAQRLAEMQERHYALMVAALERNTQAVNRLQSMPAGHVVTVGADDARGALSVAVVSHLGENGDLQDKMARTLRVA